MSREVRLKFHLVVLLIAIATNVRSVNAQNRFDTEIAKTNGKVFSSINQTLFGILNTHAGHFDRSQRYFEVGSIFGEQIKHASTRCVVIR